jgi:hypothetical protein
MDELGEYNARRNRPRPVTERQISLTCGIHKVDLIEVETRMVVTRG